MADTLKISALNRQRIKLGLSSAALARKIGTSVSVVQRIMSGNIKNPHAPLLAELMRELGIMLPSLNVADAQLMRRAQAKRKAERLVELVQGSSSLDNCGVSEQVLCEMRLQTERELLSGSNRRLWSA